MSFADSSGIHRPVVYSLLSGSGEGTTTVREGSQDDARSKISRVQKRRGLKDQEVHRASGEATRGKATATNVRGAQGMIGSTHENEEDPP